MTAGGALMNTTEVENFPGFRDGIMGPALMDEMRAQAERFGAELVSDDVVAMDLTGDVKTVRTATDTYSARAVILATGSGYRELGLPNEKELSGRGVSWCATCDGFFFRDQHIAVVGGGDSAIEEATFLTRFGTKVSLIHRRDELRASKIMQERAFADPKLEIIWNSEVAAINGTDRLESLTLRDTTDGIGARAAGHRACSSRSATTRARSWSRARSTSTTRATSLVSHPSTATNLPGVFACGDLVDHHYRQAITAAGTGCAAALDAERYVAELDHTAATGAEAQRPWPARRRATTSRAPGSEPSSVPSAERQRERRARRRDAEQLSAPWCSLGDTLWCPRLHSPVEAAYNRKEPPWRTSLPSPMPTSRRRCSSPTSRSWSTSGPSGAVRAARSPRSSTSSPTSTATRSPS